MPTFIGSATPTEIWEHFELNIEDRVARITFNRPDKLNALTFQSYADLRDLLHELPKHDVKVVVITGEGRAFCSGGDVYEIIGELLKMEPDELLTFTRMTGAVVQAARECPIPIISAINGMAAGAGSVIALASDFRIMSDKAKFAFLFTKVGLAGADMGSAYLLPRIVGAGRATELLMLGDTITAEVALNYGLANSVVAPAEVVPKAMEIAQRIATGPSFAYAQTKACIVREQDMSLSAAIEFEAVTQALLMKSQDHREFHRAFVAKDTPKWRGR